MSSSWIQSRTSIMNSISGRGIALTDRATQTKLRVGVHRHPGPNAAAHEDSAFVFLWNIRFLCVAEGPNLVGLYAAAGQSAEGSVLVLGAGRREVYQKA